MIAQLLTWKLRIEAFRSALTPDTSSAEDSQPVKTSADVADVPTLDLILFGERAPCWESGLRFGRSRPGTLSVQAVIVLDIEGTTTPISFVADVLFPYAKQHVGAHLRETYDTPETQDDIRALREQVGLRIKLKIDDNKPR